MKRPHIFKSFIKDPERTSYEGEDRDERVHLLIRQSLLVVYTWVLTLLIFLIIPFFLIPLMTNLKYEGNPVFSSIFLFCFTVFWYIFSAGFAFQNFLSWYFEVLLVTNKKIVDIDRGCTKISETPIRNVQDVTSKMRGNINQVLNIGDISIQTAAEREEFEFDTVDNPSYVRDAISDLITKEKNADLI